MSSDDGLTIQARIDFIQSTPLASLIDSDLPAVPGGFSGEGDRESASVAGAHALLFSKDVSKAQKEDVELTTVFAQLATAATFREDKWGSPEAYSFYINVLNRVGWLIIEKKGFEKVDSADLKGSPGSLLVSLLATPSPSFKDLFAKVLALLQSSPAANALFEKMSTKGDTAMYQSGIVTINPDDRVELELGVYTLKAQEHIPAILFWDLHKNKVAFYQGYVKATLMPDIMDNIRDILKKKLANRGGGPLGINLPLWWD